MRAQIDGDVQKDRIDITGQAEANIAAVNYHFGSKDELIRAVMARRLAPISEIRHRRLEDLASPDLYCWITSPAHSRVRVEVPEFETGELHLLRYKSSGIVVDSPKTLEPLAA